MLLTSPQVILQDELLAERAMVDAATQQENEEDLHADEARQQVQQQNQAFIKAYLHERQAAQLNQALDAAAEEARKKIRWVSNNNQGDP